jgi:hypothetical protein
VDLLGGAGLVLREDRGTKISTADRLPRGDISTVGCGEIRTASIALFSSGYFRQIDVVTPVFMDMCPLAHIHENLNQANLLHIRPNHA